jgi:hypothetical protein
LEENRMKSHHRSTWRRTGIAMSIILTPLVLFAAVLIAYQANVQASSHREAPLISKDTFGDSTDTYVFISPENQNNIVFVGSWIPFESPEGGPYYFEWDPTALYDLYVDNDGDAKADITYTLSSRVAVGNGQTFLYNTNPINTLDPVDTDWNRRQYISVTEQLEDGTVNVLVADKLTTPSNIGEKSTPDYEALLDQAIYPFTTADGPGKLYAGQTDDPFWVDLQVFDLLTLRGQPAPVGYTTGTNIPVDSVSGYNVHSLVVEVPIAHVTDGDPVVGMWSGTRRPSQRVLLGAGGLGGQDNTGANIQISRLGMPLVNEVVIPLALKDAFNSISPDLDVQIYTGLLGAPVAELLQRSVEDPEIGRLLCALYSVPLPGDGDNNCSTEVTVGAPRSGRGDIFDIFLTGMKLAAPFTINTASGPFELPAGFVVNRPQNPAINITGVVTGVVPAEMLRINTTIKGDLCSPTPSRLGVLGGDACGFPNGRRLTDDIVEIELAAVAGAAYAVLDGRDAGFSFNGGLLDVLDDNINYNDVPFRGATTTSGQPTTFPYMAVAQSGQNHWHTNPFFKLLVPWISKN